MQPQVFTRGDGGVESTATTPLSGRKRSRRKSGKCLIKKAKHSDHPRDMRMKVLTVTLCDSGYETSFAFMTAVRESRLNDLSLTAKREGHRVKIGYPVQLDAQEVEDLVYKLARTC